MNSIVQKVSVEYLYTSLQMLDKLIFRCLTANNATRRFFLHLMFMFMA